MKKVIIIVGIVMFSLAAIWAINSTNNPPEEVVKMYLNAINNEDWDTAKSLSTEESQEFVEMFEFMAALGDMYEDVEKPEQTEWTLEKIVCQIDGNNCVCSYLVNGQEASLVLAKRDGKWLVDQRKEMIDDDLDFEFDFD